MFRQYFFSLSQYLDNLFEPLQSDSFHAETQCRKPPAPLFIFFWPATAFDKPRAHSWRSAIPVPNLDFSSVECSKKSEFKKTNSNYNRNISFLLRMTSYGLPLQLHDEQNLIHQSTIGIYMIYVNTVKGNPETLAQGQKLS